FPSASVFPSARQFANRFGRGFVPQQSFTRSKRECQSIVTFGRGVRLRAFNSSMPICLEVAMSQTVGDFLVQRLHRWDVRHIFGYPGDGINGVFGALNRTEGKIQFVQARHEEMAAFMASAYAKFSGKLGVCIATSGPGASHLITGL